MPRRPLSRRPRLKSGITGQEQAIEIVQQGRALSGVLQELKAPEARHARELAHIAFTQATDAKEAAERAVASAEHTLSQEEQADSVAESLTRLVEHGERLGLHDSHCPLCSAIRTSQQFRSGLSIARKRIESLASGVGNARQTFSSARANADRVLQNYTSAKDRWMAITQREANLLERERQYVEQLRRIDFGSSSVRSSEEAERAIAAERDKLIDLERALLTGEASRAVSATVAVERRISARRDSVETTAKMVQRSQAAVATARTIERAVKRVIAEMIEERLAQINPLLNELYQRLRPHADWREIDYRIRGDVRRYLSLRVGESLNPQFVLSSGQRRVAGLAFLLSVHISRGWTPWRTLVLDDPMQHIDDFRALHFVEILSALRLSGRQIVCAVEDEALAKLLCRRLFSTSQEPGLHYRIDLDKHGIAAVVGKEEISPLPTDVLRSEDSMG